MTSFKESLKDSSLFRKVYIIDLFFCMVSFLQVLSYVLIVPLFIWGLYLIYTNQRRYNTFFNMRFGLWMGLFLIFSFISMLFNISITLPISIVMFLHVLICFFLFYGMHTEPSFNFRQEIFDIAKTIIYFTTVTNIFGLFCLMFGFYYDWKFFDWYRIGFPIYENRFTSVFFNPNLLGFVSVVALLCCHMLTKPVLNEKTEGRRVNKVWLGLCVVTNLFALNLCDSNAAFVLGLGYVIIYIAYIFFARDTGKTFKNIFIRVVAVILIAAIFAGASLMFRAIFQTGFAAITAKTHALADYIFDNHSLLEDLEEGSLVIEDGQPIVTFGHTNKNLDSGRMKLWRESLGLFRISPVIGVSHGNIIYYSGRYLSGTLKFDYNHSDLHNGFLTILVSTGLIGFLIFATIGFRFAKHAASALFWQKETRRDDVFPCMFAFLGAYLGYSLFEKALLYDISFMVMFFWLIMGYTAVYIMEREHDLTQRSLFKSKRLTRAML